MPVLATVACLCALAAGLALSAEPAAAALRHPYLSQLTGVKPGKPFSEEACGVTVDPASQDVYVADPGTKEIDVFSSAGVYESKITSKGLPKGFVAFGCGVAIDDTTGEVYVAGSAGKPTPRPVVYVFNSAGAYLSTMTGSTTPAGSFGEGRITPNVAVDQATGEIYVTDTHGEVVDRFDSGGEYVSQLEVEAASTPEGIATDSDGDVYVVDDGLKDDDVVDEFGPEGSLLRDIALTGAGIPTEPPGKPFQDVAVASSGDVYVSSAGGGVDEFDPSGTFVDQTTGAETPSGSLGEAQGVAVDAAGDLYVAGKTAFDDPGHPAVADVFGPAVLVPDVSSGQASALGANTATVGGTVDPDGLPVNSCAFEYGTGVSYDQSAPCESSPGAGEAPVAVSAHLTGLKALTVYHFRLAAGNAHGVEHGADETFETFGPPTVDSESVHSVGSDGAILEGQIDPDGYDTRYRFEYGPSTAYGTSLPVPDADIGSGVSDVPVGTEVAALQPDTTYHFRVVAVNPQGTTEGSDHTFTTRLAGAGLVLPDARAWELVSPPDKYGAGIEGMSDEGQVIQASEYGGAITYGAGSPTEAEPAGNRSGEPQQILSTRGSDGWGSQDIATPHELATGLTVGKVSEYQLFSSDLSLGLVEPKGATPLSPEASEKTLYLRNDGTCEPPPKTCYAPLVTAANVPPGARFGPSPTEPNNEIHFFDATPDLAHVVLSSTQALTAGAVSNKGAESLYEWTAGTLALVSVLPDGESTAAEGESASLGFSGNIVRHAISGDGSRVIWEAGEHLYLRDMSSGETIQLDAPEEGAEGGEGAPRFQTASEDGSKVFFTDSARLTRDSGAAEEEEAEPDLYEFELSDGGPLTGKLIDLTAEVESAGEHADVQGVVPGASEDGTYLYFVAKGALATGASAGEDNLYMRHGGATTFIAALSSEDAPDWDEVTAGAYVGSLSNLTSRVSPDGRYLAFMSDRKLTGYDNVDASSPPGEPQPDEEVFLYDASTDRLVCASCDPTGARPIGVPDSPVSTPLVDNKGIWRGRRLAGSVPGWTNADGPAGGTFYQSRYLSDGGRLFFDSADALVPQDTNGKEDVYEYEPEGVGSCASSSETFSAGSGGCVGLISSGTSSEESAFLDAGESGADVFFLTAARLSSQDVDSAFDVYDAHECSEAAPCLTPPAAPPAPCATSESCRPGSSSAPSIFESEGSATFSGAGNLAQGGGLLGAKALAKPKLPTRAQKLAKALKACGKLKRKRKRAACERQARKRYGAGAKKKPRAKMRKPGAEKSVFQTTAQEVG